MNESQQKVADVVRSAKIAMMTHVSRDGVLIAHPMGTQDVDFTGTVLFIAERESDKVRDLATDPRVNLACSGCGAWVSLAGKARVVDEARLRELWNSFTDAWLEGGPDNPNNILIEVEAESAEYWDAPGNSRSCNWPTWPSQRSRGSASRATVTSSTSDLRTVTHRPPPRASAVDA